MATYPTTGHVVLQLPEAVTGGDDADGYWAATTLEQLRKLRQDGLEGLAEAIRLLDEIGAGGRSQRLVPAALRGAVAELDRYRERGAPDEPSPAAFWRVDLRGTRADADEVAGKLRDLLPWAYLEPILLTASPGGATDHSAALGYLDRPDLGVDARFRTVDRDVRERLAEIRIGDVELGWSFSHDDLTRLAGTTPIWGANLASGRPHGTAVLGILVGDEDGDGVVGLVPDVGGVVVASCSAPQHGLWQGLLAATTAAAAELSAGDVLLLEVEHAGIGAVELVDPAVRGLITQASRKGIVVVEPAGNQGRDLDVPPDGTQAVLGGSAAVVVGACTATVPGRTRLPESNFGTGVTCHAWGERILAATAPGWGKTAAWAPDFGGTSGAAAVVAGVVALLQAKALSRGRRLDPAEVRALLADPAHGVPLPGEGIGPMPSLAAAFSAVEVLVP